VRERLARELREPEALAGALCLGREALALSVSALLAARGELPDGSLGPTGALAALGRLEAEGTAVLPADPDLEHLMAHDPIWVDELPLGARRELVTKVDGWLCALRAQYEPRSTPALARTRALRVAAVLLLLAASLLLTVLVLGRP
jgi:hypothetical protein